MPGAVMRHGSLWAMLFNRILFNRMPAGVNIREHDCSILPFDSINHEHEMSLSTCYHRIE